MRTAAILALLLTSRAALAEGIVLDAGLGYAAPVGSAERGSRVGDSTFGQIPITLGGAYPITSVVGVVARGQYGIGIPTQCASTSECQSSLGRDVVLAIGARFVRPRLLAEATIGYEWLTTRLVDGDGSSSRAYRGPVLSVDLIAPFALGKGWTIGPALGLCVGTFTSYALETNAMSPSGGIEERAWHAWLSLSVRVGLAL